MREIDLKSIKDGDIICTENNILLEYNSIEFKDGDLYIKVSYDYEYYHVHFWYYDKNNNKILETLSMNPVDVDLNIRNEKLNDLGIWICLKLKEDFI